MFQPIQSGPRKSQRLDRDEFEGAGSLYYQMMGWDEKRVSAKAKLWELDLSWIEIYLPPGKYHDQSR